jgi:hypothetical protein
MQELPSGNRESTTQQDTSITLFNSPIAKKEREKALRSLFEGHTPPSDVRKRIAGGGNEVNYVNGYWMFRQASLITGYRWSHIKLKERFRPNEEEPKEIGVDVLVTIWDNQGNKFEHTATGQKDVARYSKDDYKGNYKKGDLISIFDDIKSAETDGIKKALSYFGIANDIYGGRELQFFGNEAGEKDSESSTSLEVIDYTGNDAYKGFGKWLKENGILWSEAYKILGTEIITDFKDAYEKIKKEKGL